MSTTRQAYIDAGLLAPTQDRPPYITPIQLPSGTRVFRIDPDDIPFVPYKAIATRGIWWLKPWTRPSGEQS